MEQEFKTSQELSIIITLLLNSQTRATIIRLKNLFNQIKNSFWIKFNEIDLEISYNFFSLHKGVLELRNVKSLNTCKALKIMCIFS